MLVKIKCTRCGSEGALSLSDPSYEGPYRCWKCRELFTIRLEGNELKSCEPLSEADFEKQQEIHNLRSRFQQRD